MWLYENIWHHSGSVKDLKDLKMRITGLGGEVLHRASGTPVNLPSDELFTSLKSSATEWAGPYNDLAFDFHKAAKQIYESYDKFRKQVTKWDDISERECLNIR